MRCLKPLTIRVDSNPFSEPYSIQVPCGKCELCVKRYQNSWALRLFYEFKSHKESAFVTLTYRNASIPTIVDVDTGLCHYSLNKVDVRKWIKRLRHTVTKPFKYYCCGEYGPGTKRPHYHLIFFGLNKSDLIPAFEDWKLNFGYVFAENVNLSTTKSLTNSALYVSKYTNKGSFENPQIKQFNLEPEFRLMSKGIGIFYVDKFGEFHLKSGEYYEDKFRGIANNLNAVMGNAVYSLPRYFKDKIFPPKTLLRHKVTMASQKVLDERYSAELASLSATIPENKAVSQMALREIADAECSAYNIRINQSKQYEKSKL